MKRLTPFFTSIRNNVTALVLFLILWAICAAFFPAYVIPSPLAVLRNVNSYLRAGFVYHFLLTLYRTVAGFLGAFTLGTLLGIWAASKNSTQHLNTLMVLFQVIPGTILGIIFLLVFGIGNKVPIALVAFLTLPMISINTSGGLAKKNILLEEYLRSIGGTRADLVRNIYMPSLIPAIQSNLTIGFSLSLKVVILGEFIGSQDGIGYLLNVSKIYFRMEEVFFYLLVIFLVMVCFQIIENICFSMFLGKYFYPE